MATKPWWKSKTIWSDVLTVLRAALPAVDSTFHTHIVGSALYTAALAILGGAGIYGRVSSTTTLTTGG